MVLMVVPCKRAQQTYINERCYSEEIGELEEKKAELLQGMALQFNVTMYPHSIRIPKNLKRKRKWYDFSVNINT